jgi:hypothetical protein
MTPKERAMPPTMIFRGVGRLVAAAAAAVLVAPLSGVGAAHAAETTTTRLRVPTDYRLFIPCANGGAGEVVHLTGTIMFVERVTRDDAGGFHETLIEVEGGTQGVGETTGDHYVSTFVNLLNFSQGSGELPITSTAQEIYRVNGPGPGNESLIRIRNHSTVNANGDVTVVIDEFSSECEAQEP